jgi:L-cysteine desulfidase
MGVMSEGYFKMDQMNHDLLIVLKKELIAAMGCTEPAAAALAGATAVQALRTKFALEPERMSVTASRDIIKNAMSVGLPNSSLRGLKAAVVLGALSGKPQDGLAVLAGITPDVEARARVILKEERVDLQLKEVTPSSLFKSRPGSDMKRSRRSITARQTECLLLTASCRSIVPRRMRMCRRECRPFSRMDIPPLPR